MKKLPIGIQSFSELRTRGNIYVDKTQLIHRLVTSAKYYFLSRPRRFGKSLLVTTMKELFSGNKELFKDLWIEDQWDWGKIHPVVQVGFSSIGYQTLGLEKALKEVINKHAAFYGIPLQKKGFDQRFGELLEKLSEKRKVVLLIDEYDKPIIDYLGDELPQALENQKILKAFYSVLKDSDDFLELVFITGVSRFSKVSIFSDLNNLHDITLHPKYATITGYTQKDLESYFEGYLQEMAALENIDKKELIQKIKLWYNGYSWNGKIFVYNPFSILLLFSSMEFLNYWFKTATPTFLINLIKGKQLYDFEDTIVGQTLFDNYDIRDIDVVSLLFQTGYLTIKERDEFGLYRLGYPNKEVKDSMLDYLIGGFANRSVGSVAPMVVQIRTAFIKNDLNKVQNTINGLLKNLPYQLFEKTEAFYHALVHLTFFYLGVYINSEVCTSDGRADAIVQTDTHIYCLEFKINESGETALQQILDKTYLNKYGHLGKELIGIGVNFSTEAKKIDGWEVKALN